jgi:serine-type D-Ala-D-Ala carboxypeptidase (penicillin-binding protein 5/6)
MPYTLFQGGRKRQRGWVRAVLACVTVAVCAAGGLLLFLGETRWSDRPDGGGARAGKPAPGVPRQIQPGPAPLAGGGTALSPLAVRLDDPHDRVHLRFKRRPRSGLLFDLDTGRVLWRRDPTRVLPIASLTKMMTALVVADRVPRGAKVKITKEALAYKGSAVGVLPRNKWIGVNTMLHGLMLPSGNDAAIALAQRAAGTVPRFVRLMNRKARSLGITCTRFSSPHGYKNRGNHSCAPDLAAIARALLRNPRLARIVRRRQAVMPFPIKGRKIFLYNNNPLLRTGYPGTTGVKTGYTDAAGRCLVASARRGRVRLGVVLLHSDDPGGQAKKLLDRGFAYARRSAR